MNVNFSIILSLLHSAFTAAVKSLMNNIHNWPLQAFSQDYDLASYTTYAVCINFIREWLNLQSNIDSGQQIFEKLFHSKLIYS